MPGAERAVVSIGALGPVLAAAAVVALPGCGLIESDESEVEDD
jgi:hypothetical protein